MRELKTEKYVVKNIRMRQYLYSLGFYYEKVKDETTEVWLFERSPLLSEAIGFYTRFKKKRY